MTTQTEGDYSVARGVCEGAFAPPSQCFVLNRNGFSLIGLVKKDFSCTVTA